MKKWFEENIKKREKKGDARTACCRSPGLISQDLMFDENMKIWWRIYFDAIFTRAAPLRVDFKFTAFFLLEKREKREEE